ncbi:MAG: hypothetical protein LAO21_21620 [Acidobacteriia bacterium]|nr:hypothetical protein [Terriglobia bacterium]
MYSPPVHRRVAERYNELARFTGLSFKPQPPTKEPSKLPLNAKFSVSVFQRYDRGKMMCDAFEGVDKHISSNLKVLSVDIR